MPSIYVDADACPVKEEVYRVAQRHGWHVHIVAHLPMRTPEREWITPTFVDQGMDAADDWIAEHVEADDICVTNDIPLADRCIKRGAAIIRPNGTRLTEVSIGEALATRDLLAHLRDTTDYTGGGPPPFTKKDRSRFLQELHVMMLKSNQSAGSE